MDKSKILYVKNEQYFLFDGFNFTEANNSFAKKHPVTLIAPPSALYVYSSKLPSSLSDEEAELQMDIAMHEEGGANEEEEYAVGIFRHSLPDEKDDLVDLFGLTHTQADALYGNIAKKTKSIDMIVPSFLIYQTLYKEEETQGTDLYIYFSDEEAYGVLFKDGRYIAHRSMENLAHLSVQTRLDLETLKALLKTKGIKEESYEADELETITTIQDYMSKCIERIVHTFNHKRGIFGLDGLDRVFIDFEGSVIPGIESIFEAYGIEISSIAPLTLEQSDDISMYHDIVAGNYLLDMANGRFRGINVTPYERELPLFQKPVGHLLGILFCTLLIVGVGWYILDMLIQDEQRKLSLLNSKIAQAENREKLAKTKSNSLTKELETINTQISEVTEEENKVEETRSAISLFENSPIRRSQMMDDALMGLSKNNLGVIRIDQNGTRNLFLHIVTTPDKQPYIANFMNFMAKRGYQRSYTKQIIKQDGMYESVVEVVR